MNKIIIVVVAIGALAIGMFSFNTIMKKPLPEFALFYDVPRDIKPFQLTDHQGNIFDNDALKNKWSWVFFGYTSCPDVCPTTLQELNFIYDELNAIQNNNQVLLISVDPNRDSQTKLASYIGYFNTEFKALRADHGVLFPLARNLGLMYAITDDIDADAMKSGYLVDHSASIVLINPAGKIAAIFKPEQVLGQVPVIEGSKLVSDFSKITALY